MYGTARVASLHNECRDPAALRSRVPSPIVSTSPTLAIIRLLDPPTSINDAQGHYANSNNRAQVDSRVGIQIDAAAAFKAIAATPLN